MKGRLQESPLIHVHAFSSISADVGNAGQSNYAAANGALSAMMRSSAQEVSPAGPSLQLSAPLLACWAFAPSSSVMQSILRHTW